jgi:hypothetical protein
MSVSLSDFSLLRNYLLTLFADDYNSWVESERGRKLAASLDKDDIIAEGYKELYTGRTYLVQMGDWRKNKDDEVALDGIGGVNILVKADVHRAGEFFSSSCAPALINLAANSLPQPGINFPCYAFENQAETEGFAKMAKRAGYQVFGLPNYVVWHIDTKEKPGNL